MTSWEIFLNRLLWDWYVLNAWLQNHTGRCSACPKRIRGPHKLTCSRLGSVAVQVRRRRKPAANQAGV
jgi:hypothetical protein